MEDIFETIKDDTHKARQYAAKMLKHFIADAMAERHIMEIVFKDEKNKRFNCIITLETLKAFYNGNANKNAADLLTSYINFYKLECDTNTKSNTEGLDILNYFYIDIKDILKPYKKELQQN